jgi:hypothetical protein
MTDEIGVESGGRVSVVVSNRSFMSPKKELDATTTV